MATWITTGNINNAFGVLSPALALNLLPILLSMLLCTGTTPTSIRPPVTSPPTNRPSECSTLNNNKKAPTFGGGVFLFECQNCQKKRSQQPRRRKYTADGKRTSFAITDPKATSNTMIAAPRKISAQNQENVCQMRSDKMPHITLTFLCRCSLYSLHPLHTGGDVMTIQRRRHSRLHEVGTQGGGGASW